MMRLTSCIKWTWSGGYIPHTRCGGTFAPFWNTRMSFDWSQYLNVAKELAGDGTTPANQEAKLRAAISRAY